MPNFILSRLTLARTGGWPGYVVEVYSRVCGGILVTCHRVVVRIPPFGTLRHMIIIVKFVMS